MDMSDTVLRVDKIRVLRFLMTMKLWGWYKYEFWVLSLRKVNFYHMTLSSYIHANTLVLQD